MTSSTHANFPLVVLTLLLFVAFFPGLFHFLWTLPFSLLSHSPPVAPAPAADSYGSSVPGAMGWLQKSFSLPPRSRGSYLVTDHVIKELPEIQSYKIGLLNLFIQHTSCALSLNENWDEAVRADMSDALDRIAPEAGPKGQELYRHSAEGPDDMPVR